MVGDGDPGPAAHRRVTGQMRGWAFVDPGPIDTHPLQAVERPIPAPGPGEIRVRVSTCGVCRTDLHLAEGDLQPRGHAVIPGHEVVGVIDQQGPGTGRFALGQRVGIPWLRATDQTCQFCRRGSENLCVAPSFTGWDADGGYAEYAVVNESYAYALPEVFSDEQAAPLLCAGIIGFRALRRSALPSRGRLGIYGFGGSAHLAAQVAMHEGATVHVMTRSVEAQQLARSLGVASAQGASDPPPERLDAAILFAPVGDLVPPALQALDRGGTLAIAGIYLSDIPSLNYECDLFEERNLCSVTANTRADGVEFLRIAAEIPIEVTTTPFPFSDAPAALRELAHDRIHGAGVLKLIEG
jgi:alcohol dehydrogenase, propanol-preferring